RARRHRLDAAPLVGRDAVLEKVGVDPEPLPQPLDRLARRTRLAALDLADVFLAEAVAGQLGLRQSGRDTELAQALAQARTWEGGTDDGLADFGHQRLFLICGFRGVTLMLHQSSITS